MGFDPYTLNAHIVFWIASQEAIHQDKTVVGTDHLALALLKPFKEEDKEATFAATLAGLRSSGIEVVAGPIPSVEPSIASRALEACQLSYGKACKIASTLEIDEPVRKRTSEGLSYSDPFSTVKNNAICLKNELGDNRTGTSHLLLTLLEYEHSAGYKLFRKLRADIDQIIEETHDMRKNTVYNPMVRDY